MGDPALGYHQHLAQLGWKPHFAQQIALAELDGQRVARVMAVQRAGLALAPGTTDAGLFPLGGRWYELDAEQRPTPGDWVVLDEAGHQLERVLERVSLLKRVVAGRTSEVQLIGANVDTLFIVSSCNQDFNPARLERYLALAYDSGCQPVIVLTKADLAEDAEVYRRQAEPLGTRLPVELVNATAAATLDGVRAWCGPQQTVALLGSSGVGKSTLLNSLAGRDLQATGGIREDDAKGRHTTTYRSLHPLPSGGLVLDSPGIRELQLPMLESGLEDVFADLEALAKDCRFRDCQHDSEPGCAVRAAIDAGLFDPRRLDSYKKLKREERYARETAAERHARVRGLHRVVRRAVDAKNDRYRR